MQLGQLRRIADPDGLNVIRFDGSETAVGKLVERLKQAGCAVGDNGLEWLLTQRFRGLDSYTRRAPSGI